MAKYKRIFIVGQSGSGKGVLGEGVAKALGWTYMNADYALATSIGRQVEEILGKEGEAKFQQCLSDVLSSQLGRENLVMVTDDSIIDLNRSQKILSDEFTVYLKVSTPVQIERIAHNRPFIPVTDYKGFLDQLHQKRDSLFEKVAKLTVNSDDNALEEHIKKVVNAVEQ